jgi:mannose-1-phosphate guanylyltransferase
MFVDAQSWRSRAAGEDNPIWIVVLAGGQGRRLETFLRSVLGETRPKQFCPIIGRRSMLRHTWDRACRLVPASRVVTVITAGQEAYLAREAAEQDLPGHVLVQPSNRGTGPGLMLPLLWIAHRQPDAAVAVFPADHFIWEESRFLAHVAEAVTISRRRPDRLVLLGMEPDEPETSYGWIEPGIAREGVRADRPLFSVANFWEKPDSRLARQLHAQGCLWNSFVMAGTAYAFLQMLRRHHAAVLAQLQAAGAQYGTSGAGGGIATAYGGLPAVDFSRDILARNLHALLVQPVRHLTWSDWGQPARIVQTLERIGSRPPWLAAIAKRPHRIEETRSATGPSAPRTHPTPSCARRSV